jgi:peptidoglycan/LPS O-acetylase OafA/YrhL
VPALGRVPAFDGLRGTAIVLVLLSQLWLVMPAGFRDRLGPAAGLFNSGSLGVVLFLVLSGFLVTTSLLAARQRTGSMGLQHFWSRRLARICGPLFAMLAVLVLVGWAESFRGSTATSTMRSVWRVATFTFNWALIENPGGVRADLRHLWYLGVEQQFYAVWVLVLALLWRQRRLLGALLAASAVGVVIWRAVVFEDAGWWEASLRTSTRIDGLLLGALAAIIWRASPRPRQSTYLAAAGTIAMVALIGANFQSTTTYLGPLGAGFAVAATTAVVGLAGDRGPTARALGWRPLRMLGGVSFAVYVWHLPIFYAFARWGRHWGWPVRLLIAMLVLVVAVAVTRRFVERPIARWLAGRSGSAPTVVRSDRARFTQACVAGGIAASVPFLMVLWNFGLRPLRTAVPTRIFSDFYDIQARALMHGRLDVPRGALTIEAFRVGGRDYMYFPPLPAILRMPVLAVTDSLDGRLTSLSMLLAWVLTVTFIALLMWRVRGLVRPGAALGRGEAFAYGLLVAVIAGGSVLVFIAALPWVYHEAYMWSTAMAIGAIYAVIGILERPTAGRVLFAGAVTLGCVLSRTTAGWACGLTLIAAAGVLLFQARYRANREWALCVFAAGLIPLAIGVAINWAKFRHPFLFPLESQIWTDLNVHRRRALEANGGGLTGPQFFTSSLVNYFRPDGIRVVPVFPFVTLPAEPARSVGGAFLDQTYRTGSVPAFMPLLFGLGVWGLILTFRRRASDGLARLRVPVLGALAVAGGVMFYGYIAHRYTAEFLPALVVLSAIGMADATRRFPGWTHRTRRAAATALIALAVFGVVANTAVGGATARVAEGGQSLRNLMSVRMQISEWSGRPLAGFVDRANAVDDDAPADQLRIVGDCDAVYLATGDQYEPWRPVDVRGVSLDVTATGRGGPGRIPLIRFDGAVEQSLVLDHDGRGNFRLAVDGGSLLHQPGDWYAFQPDATFTVDVWADGEESAFVIDAPALLYDIVPMQEWDRDWISIPTRIRVDIPSLRLQRARGARVEVRWHQPSSFCRQLLGVAD